MTFRGTQQESRQRYLATYDAGEAAKNDAWVSVMTSSDHDACIADVNQCVQFREGMDVLDAGSGTGALCLALVRIPGLRLTALEPCPAMNDLLVAKPELKQVETVRGFCDHADDQSHFAPNSFDMIASRQLANGLFDPLAAFHNCNHWLRPGGTVVVMDGLFGRDAWTGTWDGIVDTLPLSACQTTATVPYLLEQVGFRIDHVGPMLNTNALPSTQTPRYIVAATK